MGGAPALGGAGAGAAEVEALLREFPALGRTEDGRVKCSLTGHVMHAKPEVVRPYVRGKRFTQASAKARALDALKQFEPHIVRSAFLPDKLFCRITGRYLAANERAVALFEEAGKVIMSPRCMNCHPATERPTQTNKMTPHQPLVVRGEGGMGAAGLFEIF